MPFDVISVDCPWSFNDSLKNSNGIKRSAEDNYSTMSLYDIKRLKIRELAAEDGCMLFHWVPSSLLQEGLDVMKEWGFQFKQTFVWVKGKKNIPSVTSLEDLNECLAFGMGRLTRACHEIALIGINNTGVYKKLKNKSQRSVCIAENAGHSIKPEHPQDRLDLMFPDSRRLEIFARRSRPGWVCIGNGITPGEDITVSIDNLLKVDNALPILQETS